MSDGVDPTSSPKSDDPLGERDRPRVTNITLSESERRDLLASIDRQLAEIDSRAKRLAS